MNIEGEPAELYVRPLLLIPLIENAFKHGMSQQTGDKWIRMGMTILPGTLNVQIENSYSALQQNQVSHRRVGGVGLENVRKRLKLLYPEAHEFTHEGDGEVYRVLLRIPLERKPAVTAMNQRRTLPQVPASLSM
jgi:LytS/YehU family sensor histidine kinase